MHGVCFGVKNDGLIDGVMAQCVGTYLLVDLMLFFLIVYNRHFFLMICLYSLKLWCWMDLEYSIK
jgi:hypothetical protein